MSHEYDAARQVSSLPLPVLAAATSPLVLLVGDAELNAAVGVNLGGLPA
jgi:hypothetical protein